MKRFLSLLLVLTMLCSFATAFAAEEAPAEELPAEEIIETVPEESPAEETPAEAAPEAAPETPAEEPAAEEVPVEEPAAEEAVVSDGAAEELPAEEIAAEPAADGEGETNVIELNEKYRTAIERPGDTLTYTFTPEQSGLYTYFSIDFLYAMAEEKQSEIDDIRTAVSLYGPDNTLLGTAAASGQYYLYTISYEMTAGTTYRYVLSYVDPTQAGPFYFGVIDGVFVQYDSNGGTFRCESEMADIGETIVLPDDVPTRAGYAFLGWSEDSSAAAPAYEAGDSYTVTGPTTLYAIWGPAPVTGTCGADLTWTLADGVLTITGSGDMYDYEDAGESPWSASMSSITSLVVADGVTGIGDFAFREYENLANVSLPASLEYIGYDAFEECPGLDLSYAGTKAQWAAVAQEDECLYGRCVACSNGTVGWWKCTGGVLTILADADISDTSLDEYPWNDFSRSITTAVIADGVTTVMDSAFSNCANLKSVTIPSSVTSISAYAFNGCLSLTEAVIPSGVTSIGNNAFRNCTALTKAVIPSSVTSIGKSAFNGCTALTEAALPSSVTNIDDYAFSGCSSLQDITIPVSVTNIGRSAFADTGSSIICYAGTMTQWDAVTKYDTNLDGHTIRCTDGDISSWWSYADGELTISANGDMKDYNYTSNQPWANFLENITSIVIENGTTSIGDYAFYECSNLESVTIAESVTSIGTYAFAGCSSLKNIEIPNTVTEIGTYVFKGCKKLESVTLPNALTTLGTGTFLACSSLKSISIPDTVTIISVNLFTDCSNLKSVKIPASVTNIVKNAFSGCPVLTIEYADTMAKWAQWKDTGVSASVLVTCTDGWLGTGWSLTSDGVLTVTADSAMADYADGAAPWYSLKDKITSVVIKSSVTSIGSYAFCGCTNLKNVAIPPSVTSIGDYAFYNCGTPLAIEYTDGTTYGTAKKWYEVSLGVNSLPEYTVKCSDNESIGLTWTLKKGILTISGEGPMMNYTEGTAPWYSDKDKITSVVIKSGVTSIGSYAFADCAELSDVSIPTSVTSIGSEAFYNCGSLGIIYNDLNSPIEDWTKITVASSTLARCIVYCSDGATGLGWNLTDGVLTITAAGAMDNYTAETTAPWNSVKEKIMSVVIASGVTNIGSYAFSGCTKMTSVTIPLSVKDIAANAFLNCGSLKTVNYDGDPSRNAITIAETGNDALLVAAWQCIYTITFNVNSGKGTFPSMTKATGETLTIPDTVPTRGSYVFLGWTDGTTEYAAGSSYTADASATLRAMWGYTGTCGSDGVTWTLNMTTGLLTISGSGAIPDYGSDFDQTKSYAPWYLYHNAITSIVIGSGITAIGANAFFDCGAAKSITVPAGVTNVGVNAFGGCNDLSSITVEEGNTFYTAVDGVLFNAAMTELVCCPAAKAGAYTVPAGVTTITAFAFDDCTKLTAVTLPDSLQSIGSYAFYNCRHLKRIVIPAGITTIETGTFYNCDSLVSVTLPAGVTSIDAKAFMDCEALQSIPLPAALTSIGELAFYDCDSLRSITIPEGVTSVGQQAFSDCDTLTAASLPSTLQAIPDGMFKYASLRRITIPENVTSIGEQAFSNNYLKSVTLPSSVKEIGAKAFYNCDQLTDVYYGGHEADRSAINISDDKNTCLTDAAWHCSYTITYDANDGTGAPAAESAYADVAAKLSKTEPTRENYAFLGWAEKETAKRADYAAGAAYTGDADVTLYAVWRPIAGKCGDDLTWSMDLDTGVLTIKGTGKMYDYDENDNKAPWYSSTDDIRSIDIADGVTTIGSCAFADCSLVTAVEIPAGVTEIGYYAFGECSLTTVVIPAGVTSLGEEVFDECTDLTEITILNPDCKIGYYPVLSKVTVRGYLNSTAQTYAKDNKRTFVPLHDGTGWDTDNATGDKYYFIDGVMQTGTVTISGAESAFVFSDKGVMTTCGHIWNSGEITTPATCTTEGMKTYTCTVCGKTKTETIPAGHTPVIDRAVAATCKDTGLTEGSHCSVCHEVLVAQEVIPVTNNHVYNSGVITTPAACTTDGVKTYTCSVCGKTKTEVIPALGHTPVTDEAVAATCRDTGLTEGSHCSVCGTVLKAQEVIPVTDEHTWGSSVTTAKATCTKDGTKTLTCTVCGKTMIISIPALGHRAVIDKAVSPTCVDTGLTKGAHCSVCGAILAAQSVIPATGVHTWDDGEITTPATCTTDGVMTYTCAVCDTTYTEAIPGGHSYDDGVITTQPTTISEGVITYTCSVCGDTYTEAIPMIPVEHEGTGWVWSDGSFYYYDDGALVTSSWLWYNNSWYYMDQNGQMATDVDTVPGDAAYYFDDSGKMQRDCWIWKDGSFFYFGSDGRMVTSGWLLYSGSWYYMDETGAMVTGVYDVPGDTAFYFSDDGKMQTNTWAWQNSSFYWFGSDGRMVKDNWLLYNRNWYYLDEDGAMVTDVYEVASDAVYYFSDSGKMQANTWFWNSGDFLYFGSDGRMTKSSWVWYNNNWYYMNAAGIMVTGTYNGYTFDDSGVWTGYAN